MIEGRVSNLEKRVTKLEKRVTELETIIKKSTKIYIQNFYLPKDIIFIILMYADFKTIYNYSNTAKSLSLSANWLKLKIAHDELLYKPITYFTLSEYLSLANAKYKVVKMFDIMEQELFLKITEHKQLMNEPIKIIKNKFELKHYGKVFDSEPSKNGRIGVNFGKFRNKWHKKIKELSKVLALVFNTSIKINSEYCSTFFVDIDIIYATEIRVMLNIIDTKVSENTSIENIIDTVMTEIELFDLLCRLLYYFPHIDIRGTMNGNSDIPLLQHHLERYISNGISYACKKPFYQRLELIKKYDKN